MDQFVFGDSESLAQSYIPVSPLDTARVSLGAGQVQAVTVDSIYEVYKPGTRKFVPPEKPIAKIQISSVEPFTAQGKLISGTSPIEFPGLACPVHCLTPGTGVGRIIKSVPTNTGVRVENVTQPVQCVHGAAGGDAFRQS